MRSHSGARERTADAPAKIGIANRTEVDNSVENIGCVVDELKRFLNSGANLAGNRDDQRDVPTKTMELIGVLYFGCNRVNQTGSSRSQPATMGKREVPVK